MFYQDLYKKAGDTHKKLKSVADKVSANFAGSEVVIPPLKSFDRIKEKVDKDYQGDWKKITDVVRGSISFQNIDDLKNAVSFFSQNLPIVYVKDRISNPAPSGYRDMLALFRDPENGIIGEIQFHLCHILKVKDEEHKLYEIAQEIERKADAAQRKLSDDERNELNKVRAQGNIVYLKASERMQNGEACSLLK